MAEVTELANIFGQGLAFLPKVLTSDHWIQVFVALGVIFFIDLVRRRFRFDWPKNVITGTITTFFIILFNILLLPALIYITIIMQDSYTKLGIPHIPTSFWAILPTWILSFIIVLAHDFANYWNHRILHTSALWPIHAVHHSDQAVTAVTLLRIHILEALVMRVGFLLLLSWLGFPPGAIGLGALFITLHGMYSHMNLDWHHGRFSMFLVSPRYHRWHHADCEEAFGKNLAGIFPFFDYFFGTYYLPGPCDKPLGAKGVPHADPIRLICWPLTELFRWVCRTLKFVILLGNANTERTSTEKRSDVV